MTPYPRFELKKAKNDMYYFVLVDKKRHVIAQSEMYYSKDACENCIERVKKEAPIAEIDDQTEAV